jgi:RNA polymerase sigma-70 factor, ECF subfamily
MREMAGKSHDEFVHRLREHQAELFHHACRLTGNREDAMDLMQETFIHAHRNFGKYVVDKSLGAWLRKLMTNRFLDLKRKRRPSSVSLEEALSAGSFPKSSPVSVEELVEQRLLLKQLVEEIRKWPETYRTVFLLRHFMGMSCTEISKELDLPEGTVKTRLFRSRKWLKERFETS